MTTPTIPVRGVELEEHPRFRAIVGGRSRETPRFAGTCAPAINRPPTPASAPTLDGRAVGWPRRRAWTICRSSRAVAPMLNRLGLVADAEAANQRGRSLTAGYAVRRLSASLSPRDRRESGRAVPRGAHRARSALAASTRESTTSARVARETLGLRGRNGEAPSDRSLGASVYRPSPSVGDEREMAPHSARPANALGKRNRDRFIPSH